LTHTRAGKEGKKKVEEENMGEGGNAIHYFGGYSEKK